MATVLDGGTQMLSPSAVAEMLDIPIATIYAWRHRGEGPPGFRVGRHVRYRAADVELWIDQRKQAEERPGRSVA